jgi:hypothetical protein
VGGKGVFSKQSQAILKGCVSEQQGKYSLVCQFQKPPQVVGGHDIVPGNGKNVC